MWLFSQHNLKVISFVNKDKLLPPKTSLSCFWFVLHLRTRLFQQNLQNGLLTLVPSEPTQGGFELGFKGERRALYVERHTTETTTLQWSGCHIRVRMDINSPRLALSPIAPLNGKNKLQQKTLLSLFEISEKSQYSNEWLMMFSK